MVFWITGLLRLIESPRIARGLESILMNQIKRFVLDESALESVEWAIVGGIVVAVGAAIYVSIAADISRGLTSLSATTGAIP